jgi:hypothetical protein
MFAKATNTPVQSLLEINDFASLPDMLLKGFPRYEFPGLGGQQCQHAGWLRLEADCR